MAKVSNETRLVISLFKEKMAKREETMKSYFGHPEETWAKGVIKGIGDAEGVLAGIVRELEHPESQ